MGVGFPHCPGGVRRGTTVFILDLLDLPKFGRFYDQRIRPGPFRVCRTLDVGSGGTFRTMLAV